MTKTYDIDRHRPLPQRHITPGARRIEQVIMRSAVRAPTPRETATVQELLTTRPPTRRKGNQYAKGLRRIQLRVAGLPAKPSYRQRQASARKAKMRRKAR